MRVSLLNKINAQNKTGPNDTSDGLFFHRFISPIIHDFWTCSETYFTQLVFWVRTTASNLNVGTVAKMFRQICGLTFQLLTDHITRLAFSSSNTFQQTQKSRISRYNKRLVYKDRLLQGPSTFASLSQDKIISTVASVVNTDSLCARYAWGILDLLLYSLTSTYRPRQVPTTIAHADYTLLRHRRCSGEPSDNWEPSSHLAFYDRTYKLDQHAI